MMTNITHTTRLAACFFALSGLASAQDRSPLKDYHVWLPMTGVTEAQLDDARAARYDTILLKIHPPLTAGANDIDFTSVDTRIKQATDKNFNVIVAVLGWVGLGDGTFWDVDASGQNIPNRLDPFWPEAMKQIEWYFARIVDHYKTDPHVVGFAPTWGIYGEAGFTKWSAGRSNHALARFNEWRKTQNIPPLEKLPTRKNGPNTEFNRFIRFRFLYVQAQFDAMIRRLKGRAGKRPVGMWQELYPIAGYLWNMVDVPSADFALYESCFPYQTVHHPEKSLAETMGFRYRCQSAADYRNYYLPLLARKRGEGQRFMGCQLSNHYAKNYGWSEQKAQQLHFDQWEDAFSPHLKKLLDVRLESPARDVLLVFPTYAAAALSDHPSHTADTKFIDVLLRMYGCQMVRCGSVRLDNLTIADMNRFRLIVIPCAACLIPKTYEKLNRTTATVLLTGCFAQSLDGERVGFGQQRTFDGLRLEYLRRPAGDVSVAEAHELTAHLKVPIHLPEDESFRYVQQHRNVRVLLRCGQDPLLSIRRRFVMIHGHLFAGASYDSKRKPTKWLSGSKDPSGNEHDPWGSYSSTNPANALGRQLIKNILEHAGVDYRVPNPKPRTFVPFLGDHMEPASISANIVYNNTALPQRLTVRTPFRPKGHESTPAGGRFGRFETHLTVAAFSYVVLQETVHATALSRPGKLTGVVLPMDRTCQISHPMAEP